jgi:hypothetical protein
MPFFLHQRYTRRQIHEAVGGDLQSYLPHVQGLVVCGCFDPEMNARAPFEIDVGDLPDVIRYAEQLAAQTGAVPVFLKNGAFEWEFVGNFCAVKLVRDPSDLYPVKRHRRPDAVAVLYLNEEAHGPQSAAQVTPEVQAAEGQLTMRMHERKERSPILADAKRRAFRAENGVLRCAACSLDESQLPAMLGEACFEVHHLLPLAELQGPAITRLDDLALLCANCHRMIHRSDPMLSPSELAQRRSGDA